MEPLPSIGVVFVTYNARELLPRSLPPFLKSSLKPRILVLNSSSNDGTVEYAKSQGVETLVVPRESFNHGLSRELARKKLSCDIVIMVTPDVILKEPSMLEKLVAPITEKKAALSYARQIPHEGADFFESFPREFNYPKKSELRNKGNFCSDSLAAWDSSALDKIGGFKETLTGEDAIACQKLLDHSYAVYYCAECIAHHSHHYTLIQEFKRSFDTGYARKLNFPNSRDEKRGASYAFEMLKTLLKNRPTKIPYSLLNLFTRYLGYLFGRVGTHLPNYISKNLSGQDFYWLYNKN